jgi:glutamine synthetase adenylyltransferase
MEALAAEFLRSLGEGKPSTEILGRAGDPDPARAADAFARAARHPDLAPAVETWAPALLLTARPGSGAQRLEELAGRYHQTRQHALALERAPSLPVLLGSSDFLARLLLRHPHWLEEVEGRPPGAPPDEQVEPDWTSIRIAKYRGLLRIAARDLVGRAFEESLAELSRLADRCLAAALACAAHEAEAAPPALLALGKLGGRELNFSSDVDLLFVYEEPPDAERLEREAQVMRLVRKLKRNLEIASEDGFGYRVDLDLRPEGRTGALANSIEGALHYYESFGADWERQMLIRLRPVTGPAAIADAFVTKVSPFIYRRLIDPGAIRAVREMKIRIEEQRRREGRELELDLKEPCARETCSRRCTHSIGSACSRREWRTH